MKKFKQLLEQHREKGRFKPVVPHNVPQTPGAVMKKEEIESLDEISAETKAAYTLKAKQQVKELEPHAKKGEYKDLAKNLIAKRKKGIAMAEGENKEMKDKDPCWKGYQMVGMKDKGGKKVPNCVPVKEEAEQITEDDLPVTTKKSKTVTVKHETSGKEKVIVDTPNAREENKKLGYHPMKEAAEKIQKHRPGWMTRMIKRDNPEMAKKLNQGKQMNKLMHKYGGKTSEEIAKMKKEAVDVPFEGGKPAKGTVTDKSGAKHSPMSRVKDIARKAMQKQMPKTKAKESSNKAEIVKKASKDSKEKFNPDPIVSNSIMKENK